MRLVRVLRLLNLSLLYMASYAVGPASFGLTDRISTRGVQRVRHPLKAPSLSLQTLQPALLRSTIPYLQLRLAFTFSHATYTYAPFNDALTLIVREWRDAVARPRQQSNL